MEIYKKFSDMFRHKFWIVLLLIAVISYGQIIFMQPWQDDNALFFKLAHISEPAGFLGKGILGEGAYKYVAFFYYPIYLLFGYATEYYFALNLIVYFFSCLSVYILAKKILSDNAAKVSSVLYAAGFIASDAYIRLFNSTGTSLSVIFACFLIYFYLSYFKKAKLHYYLLSIIYYFLSCEFIRYRTHYLIGVIVAFEFIFFLNRKYFFKKLAAILIRLIPFFFIFYKYFIENADSRSGDIIVFIKSIFSGNLYYLYGFFASFSNLIIPDKLSWYIYQTGSLAYVIIVLLVPCFLFYLLKGKPYRKIITLSFFFIPIAWYFINKNIFNSPFLSVAGSDLFLSFLGGVLLFLISFSFFFVGKDYRKPYLFFYFWLIINLLAYVAYNPTFALVSINRYLAHSQLAWIFLLGVVYMFYDLGKNKKVPVLVGIISLAILNIYLSLDYQRTVVLERSLPVKKFYQQLKIALPDIQKNDLIYFDVADNARSYFADAFSVAQMPETTAIAWRYGIDRYDFFLAENYDDLIAKAAENKIAIQNIYPFFYSKEKGLISTKKEFEKLSRGVSEVETIFDENLSEPYYFKDVYFCAIKPEISITLSAKPSLEAKKMLNDKEFPFAVALAYDKAKKDFYDSVKVFVSSEWRERVGRNLIDQNSNTVWQADRVTWDEEKTFFGFDFGKATKLERFIWVNAFANNTPINYSIETSADGKYWNKVAETERIVRIDSEKTEEVHFSAVSARFIRMVINKTLNQDSAGISESWVVPAGFEDYSIKELEGYLQSPQNALINNTSSVSVLWKSDASPNWQNDITAIFKLLTDGVERSYRISIPCRGTQLEAIKLEGFQFPMDIFFRKILISYKQISKN